MPLPGPGWEVKYFNELSNLRHGLCKRLVLLSFKWFIIWMNQILPVIAATGKFVPWFKGKSSLGNNRTRLKTCAVSAEAAVPVNTSQGVSGPYLPVFGSYGGSWDIQWASCRKRDLLISLRTIQSPDEPISVDCSRWWKLPHKGDGRTTDAASCPEGRTNPRHSNFQPRRESNPRLRDLKSDALAN